MLISDLLHAPILDGAEVLAGYDGIAKRDVQSINIMDAPDILTFLKKGDLLLTNGYLLKDRPDEFIGFITSMHRKGCAGLAIKTKRFAMNIPQTVIDEANRLQFPIIELSRIEATLGEVFQKSIGIILDNKNDELHYALNIHRQFTDMMLQGGSMGRIVQALSDILAAPVLFISLRGERLAASVHFSEGGLESLADYAGSLLLEANEGLSRKLSLGLPGVRASEYRHAELFPIHTYRQEGCLLAFHGRFPITGSASLALEQAAHVIGLELAKQQAVKERSRRYKNEFFSDLIEGHLGSLPEVLHRGAKYGLAANRKAQLLLAGADPLHSGTELAAETSGEDRRTADQERWYERIKRELGRLQLSFVMFTKNGLFGILVYCDGDVWDEHILTEKLESAVERLYADGQLSVSFGLGHVFANALDLGLSYKEALLALQAGRRMNRSRCVLSYQSMDIGRLLRMLPNEELERFYLEAFHELLTKAGEEAGELLRTLKAYYNHHCSLVETSRALFVHRNTVIYRLEKCEKLLGRKLKETGFSLRIQVAFAIEALLGTDRIGRKI